MNDCFIINCLDMRAILVSGNTDRNCQCILDELLVCLRQDSAAQLMIGGSKMTNIYLFDSNVIHIVKYSYSLHKIL